MYLENINSPEDVKRLSIENLNILADEIRHQTKRSWRTYRS